MKKRENIDMIDILIPGDLKLVGTYPTPNPTHRHEKWELMIVENGNIINHVNKTPYKATAGDVFLLGPAHLHAIEVLSPQHLHRDVYFNTSDIELALDMLSEDLKKDVLSGKVLIHLQLDMNDLTSLNKNISRLESICLVESLKQNSSNEIKKLRTISVSILQYVLGIYSTNSLLKENIYPEWLYSFLTTLHSPGIFTQSVNKIIEKTNYSHTQFGKLFKKYCGVPLIEYVKNLRLMYAANLLKSTTHTTLFICENCGYDSYSYFERVFKEKFGCTPTQYRKAHLSTL
jgi:AraC-like DNA-binding protein